MTRHINELQAGIALAENVEMTIGEEGETVRGGLNFFGRRKQQPES